MGRTSTEIPKTLQSLFLPEHEEEDGGALARLRRNPAFKDLFTHTGGIELDQALMDQIAVAHEHDQRHKIFQMSWSPEAALTYLAHRYAPTWAVNYRVMFEL